MKSALLVQILVSGVILSSCLDKDDSDDYSAPNETTNPYDESSTDYSSSDYLDSSTTTDDSSSEYPTTDSTTTTTDESSSDFPDITTILNLDTTTSWDVGLESTTFDDTTETSTILYNNSSSTVLQTTPRCTFDPKNIIFYGYFPNCTDPNTCDGVKLSETVNPKDVNFLSDRPTIFACHGLTNSYRSPCITEITKSVLAKSESNLILIDWSYYSSDPACAYWNWSKIAKTVALFIREVFCNAWNGSFNTIQLVGHSMGAHIVGLVGEWIQSWVDFKMCGTASIIYPIIPIITGLDPSPISELDSSRLKNHAASCVVVIHTSGIMGHNGRLGIVDFYPNPCELHQPGCTGIDAILCDHKTACGLYAKSILNSTKFPMTKYSDKAAFCLGKNQFPEHYSTSITQCMEVVTTCESRIPGAFYGYAEASVIS